MPEPPLTEVSYVIDCPSSLGLCNAVMDIVSAGSMVSVIDADAVSPAASFIVRYTKYEPDEPNEYEKDEEDDVVRVESEVESPL